MKIPAPYEWLNDCAAPRMMVEALKLYGTKEVPGKGNSPVIMGWVEELGIDSVENAYTADIIPWCGLFMAIVAKRAGKDVPATPLWAASWDSWGSPAPKKPGGGYAPEFGDLLRFTRKPYGGHVSLYAGEDDFAYHCLGGNQDDGVCIRRIPKVRLREARRLYRIGPPSNVKRVYLKTGGALSRSEA